MRRSSRVRTLVGAGSLVVFAVVVFAVHEVEVALALCVLALLWVVADLAYSRSLRRLPDPTDDSEQDTGEPSEDPDEDPGRDDRRIR